MRKGIAVTGLVIIIVGALGFTIWTMRGRPINPTPWPRSVMDVTDPQHPKEIVIDTHVWEKGTEMLMDNHYRRDLKTGQIYATRIFCATCRKAIPAAPWKAGEDVRVVAANYVCPICRGPAGGMAAVPPSDAE